jgi:DNA repair protein RecN (Recombination protein N)
VEGPAQQPEPAVPVQEGPRLVEAAQGPSTLVFDEVDAGIGGEAALAVGRALAELGRRYQVIVVTHLAQVAAFADAQIAVSKVERDGRSIALAVPVAGPERIIELSRMLSGQPDSTIARKHAEELLRSARSRLAQAVDEHMTAALAEKVLDHPGP